MTHNKNTKKSVPLTGPSLIQILKGKQLELKPTFTEQIKQLALEEIKLGGKIRINRSIPYIAIFTSKQSDHFVDLEDAQTMIEATPKNVLPEHFWLVYAKILDTLNVDKGVLPCKK